MSFCSFNFRFQMQFPLMEASEGYHELDPINGSEAAGQFC